MHHGYYEVGQPVKNHQEAQVDMIDNSLKWAGVDEVTSMLDVGCGIGGSSRHIARKFNCAATGATAAKGCTGIVASNNECLVKLKCE